MGSHPEYLRIDEAESLDRFAQGIPEDLPITHPGAFMSRALEMAGHYLHARGLEYGAFARPTERITVAYGSQHAFPNDVYEDPDYGPSVVMHVRARGSKRGLTLYVDDALDIVVQRFSDLGDQYSTIRYGTPLEFFRELDWHLEWLCYGLLAHDSAGDSAALVYSVAAMQWVADLWDHRYERGGEGGAPFCPEFGQDEDGVYVIGDGHAFWENGYWTNFTTIGMVEDATFEYGSF